MSWRTCETLGCNRRIRAGLRRHGVGTDGQELADGRHCARCRAKHRDPARRPPRYGEEVVITRGKLAGIRGTLKSRDRVTVGPIEFVVEESWLERAKKPVR